MMKKILGAMRILLLILTVLEIVLFISIGVELALDIKYNVNYVATEVLVSYYRYVKLHVLFLIILLLYLILECATLFFVEKTKP